MSIPKLKIVVVGGGFSGSTFAIQLLRHLPDLPMASSTKARYLVVGSERQQIQVSFIECARR